MPSLRSLPCVISAFFLPALCCLHLTISSHITMLSPLRVEFGAEPEHDADRSVSPTLQCFLVRQAALSHVLGWF